MAMQNSNAGKPMKSVESKPAETKREAPATAPQETTVVIDAVAQAAAADAPVVEAKTIEIVSEAKAPEPTAVAILPTPTPVVAESVDSRDFSAAFQFDTSLWSKKYFELWAENAQAFLDLAEQITKAKTVEEAVALQSRFAGERFEAFLRQSKEVMTLAQRMATVSVAPLCGTRAA